MNKKVRNEFRDSIYESTKTHLLNKKKILELRSYPRAFVKFMGSNEGALFLMQVIYWTEIMKNRGDGFFYKSVREWSEELDITEYQVEQFRAFLKNKGILETTMRRVGRYKEQWHYRLDNRRFTELYEDFLDYEYDFPNDGENYDDEEFAEATTHEDESEVFNDTQESAGAYQEPVTCGQESIGRNKGKASSFEAFYAALQENNNNVLNNKLHSELNSEPYNSRNTVPSAKNPRTDFIDVSDAAVEFRNTGGDSFSDARRAVDVFRSVGVSSFDVTAKNDTDAKDFRFRENVDLDSKLEQSIEWCEKNNRSFIMRPRGGMLIQIDDCTAESIKTLLPFCFFAEETSENNYQAWLALPAGTTEAERKQVRVRLLKKLEKDSGNGGAYGATRWVGSINFKPNRELFRVRLIRAENGRFTSSEELENAGMLAEPEKTIEKQSAIKESFRGCFPDYDRCLQDNENDRSDADASFLAICKARGFSRDESFEKLLEVSERANESYPSYLRRTMDFVFGEEV